MLKKKMYKKEPEMLLGIDSTTHSVWKITQKVSFLKISSARNAM